MPWLDDIAAHFPPPHDGEPASLRRDIRDELADHLDCALQHETRRTEDLNQARASVLKRFGNPQRLARQLWLDAMKEQLMNQRMIFVSQLVMVAAVGVLCIVVITSMRQNQRMQDALIARLEAAAGASPRESADAAASFNWPTLHVQVWEADGVRGMADQSIILTGEPFNPGGKQSMEGKTNAEGQASFGPMRPGIYRLSIDRHGAQHNRSVTVSPGRSETEVVKWHDVPEQTTPVQMRLLLPDAIRQAKPLARLQLTASPAESLNQPGRWSWPAVELAFDGEGHVAVIPQDDAIVNDWSLNRQSYSGLKWMDTIDLNPALRYETQILRVLVDLNDGKDENYLKQWLNASEVDPKAITLSGVAGEEINIRPGVKLERDFEQWQRNSGVTPRPRPQ